MDPDIRSNYITQLGLVINQPCKLDNLTVLAPYVHYDSIVNGVRIAIPAIRVRYHYHVIQIRDSMIYYEESCVKSSGPEPLYVEQAILFALNHWPTALSLYPTGNPEFFVLTIHNPDYSGVAGFPAFVDKFNIYMLFESGPECNKLYVYTTDPIIARELRKKLYINQVYVCSRCLDWIEKCDCDHANLIKFNSPAKKCVLLPNIIQIIHLHLISPSST